VERRDAADWVTLNRPDRLNALDQTMVVGEGGLDGEGVVHGASHRCVKMD
jgi:hypothetical protein